MLDALGQADRVTGVSGRDYITNTYSPIYTYLSDVCEWVNP